MLIKVFTYSLIDSKMYVLVENNSAIIIDPNVSEEAVKFLKSKEIKDIKVILTHEHYDHISGVEWLRKQFDCIVYCSEKCDENMHSSIKNGSKYFKALFIDKEAERFNEAEKIRPITCFGDVMFREEMQIVWEKHKVVMTETPGHSQGSICILIDNSCLFTGDSLLKDSDVITKLPGGNRKNYGDITLPYLQRIDGKVYVYPGHGDSGYMNEFKLVNGTEKLCYL